MIKLSKPKGYYQYEAIYVNPRDVSAVVPYTPEMGLHYSQVLLTSGEKITAAESVDEVMKLLATAPAGAEGECE